MKEDKYGFIYPNIDETKCIGCHKCEKVCAAINPPQLIKSTNAFAAWSNSKEIVEKSASGGAAYEISRHIIKQGGIVYGCAFDDNKAHHLRVSKVEELSRLCKSKYVQSDITGLHEMVRRDLLDGKIVLFIGTPCQVSSMKRYIGEKYGSHLITIDLICHGVPSSKMLEEHTANIIGQADDVIISFRQKGVYRFTIRKGETQQIIYEKGQLKDEYLLGFLSGSTLRQSCTKCTYSRIERPSDITLGDFWNVGKLRSEYAPENGISLILVNSDKGLALVNELSTMTIEDRPISEAVKGNYHLSKPSGAVLRSEVFKLLYRYISFEKAVSIANVDKYCKALINSRKK